VSQRSMAGYVRVLLAFVYPSHSILLLHIQDKLVEMFEGIVQRRASHLVRVLYPTRRLMHRAYTNTIRKDAPFTVLAIESSCDDTAVAIMRSDGQLLTHQTRSQLALHEPQGGIVPNLAMAAHAQALPGLLAQVFRDARLSPTEVDVIAATRGPGLPGSLSVGYNSARALAAVLGRPFIGVHHMVRPWSWACLVRSLANSPPDP
jgi:hypothetical protein